MHPVQIIMLTANAIAFPLLLWRGRTADRLATLAMIAAPLLSQLASGLNWNGAYVGIFVVDVLFFVSLWMLAERAGRWWIVSVASFQLIGLLGHFAPFLAHERLAWAYFTLMWAVWALISLTAFFGVWEVEADRRYALEGRHGSKMVDGGGAGAAATVE